MKQFTVDLQGHGLQELLREVERLEDGIETKIDTLAKQLAERGYEVAQMSYATAQYDGDNDVSVTVEERGNGNYAVVASGNAVLFIEFGTGIVYPDNHPEAGELGMVRGSYGLGQGLLGSWDYWGSPGTNGEEIGNGRYRTRGNPASMSMYNAKKKLEEELPQLVKEVFGT